MNDRNLLLESTQITEIGSITHLRGSYQEWHGNMLDTISVRFNLNQLLLDLLVVVRRGDRSISAIARVASHRPANSTASTNQRAKNTIDPCTTLRLDFQMTQRTPAPVRFSDGLTGPNYSGIGRQKPVFCQRARDGL
jgi:hypothetical protein